MSFKVFYKYMTCDCDHSHFSQKADKSLKYLSHVKRASL